MATFKTLNLQYLCGGYNLTDRNPRYPTGTPLNGLSSINGQNEISNPPVSENGICQTSANPAPFINNPAGSQTTGKLQFGFKCLFGCENYSTEQVSTEITTVLKGTAGIGPVVELNVYVPAPTNGYFQGVPGWTSEGFTEPPQGPWKGVVLDAFNVTTGSFADGIPFTAITQANNYPANDQPIALDGTSENPGITQLMNIVGFWFTDVSRTYQAMAPSGTVGPVIYTFEKWLIISGGDSNSSGGISNSNPPLFTAVQNSNVIAFAVYSSKKNPFYVRPYSTSHLLGKL